MEVLKQLKVNKTPGPDEINNELIINGGEELTKRMHKLMVTIWKDESMPIEWKNGHIAPIFKKGDPTKCCNYRPIMLLNTTYKIWTSIIRNRLSQYTEKIIGPYQQGFRTIDQRKINNRCNTRTDTNN
uniref:Uncharacterized protein LOC114346667 n=1 Tax=Diabrotica virgifera virgifera TaxID=50390 RepID=A0A6P7H3W2_DIAVI